MKINSIRVLSFALASISVGVLFSMGSAPTSENCKRLRQLAAIAQRDDATRQQLSQAKDLMSKAALLLLECNNDITAALLRSFQDKQHTDVRSIFSECCADTTYISYIIGLNKRIKNDRDKFIEDAISNNNVTLMQLLDNARILPVFLHVGDRLTTPLIYAFLQNSFEVARLLLKNNYTNINYEDRYGYTALSLASRHHEPIVLNEILPALLYNPNLRADTVSLFNAATYHNVEGMRLLLGDGRFDINAIDKTGRTILSAAISAGNVHDTQQHEELLRLILAQPALDVNKLMFINGSKTPLSWAISKGDRVAVKLLLQHPKINTKLIVKYADNKHGTALDYAKELQAAGEDRKEIIRLLEDYEHQKRQKERRSALLVRQRGVER